MIVSRSPYRISFFGGGTDYEPWFSEHGGAFLSLSINYYTYITLRVKPKFQEKRFRVLWRLAEEVGNVDLIKHPIVRETLKQYNYENKGLDLSYIGDLPGGAGMGSSSAFTAALIMALHADMNININPYDLAKFAYNIEKNKLKETVGIQDQIATSYGGFNNVVIAKNGSFDVSPVNISAENIENFIKNLVLVYSGTTRSATTIAEKKVSNMKNKTNDYIELQKMVPEAYDSLIKCDFDNFGKMLNESWKIKRQLSPVITNDHINNLYELVISNGALGGKLLGAGGGGFLLFVAKEGEKENLIKKVNDNNVIVPFKISSKGTEIVYKEKTMI